MIKDGPVPAPQVFRLELPGSDSTELAAEESAFFKTNGFIVKRHLIGPELVKAL